MHVHVAIFKWKEGVPRDAIAQVLRHVEALKEKVASISRSMRGEPSKHASGFNHVVFIRAETAQAIDAYRTHPDHFAMGHVRSGGVRGGTPSSVDVYAALIGSTADRVVECIARS